MVSAELFRPINQQSSQTLNIDLFATESEEALLKMSVSQPESSAAVLPDFSSMTEEEQIAYAMQMSLAGGGKIHIEGSFLVISYKVNTEAEPC